MRRTNALQDLLADLTSIFYEERVPVEFTSGPSSAAMDGSHVKVCSNMRGTYNLPRSAPKALELRMMVDHLSHEIEHLRESELDAKKKFVEHYEETHPQYARLAGMVVNVLEDVYIDAKRIERYPGLRRSHAFGVDMQMKDAESVADESVRREARLASGFWQVAHAGYATGIGDADAELRATFAKCRRIAQDVRDADTPAEREELAHDAMDALLAVLPDSPDEDVERAIEEGMEGAKTDDLPDNVPDAPEPPDDLDMELDEDADGDAADADAGDEDGCEDGDSTPDDDSDASGGGDPDDGMDVDGDRSDDGELTGESREVGELLGDYDPSEVRVSTR